jgi:hypothetical protein
MYTVLTLSRPAASLVGFHVLTETGMKMAAFWNTVPSSLVENDRRFRGANCSTISAIIAIFRTIVCFQVSSQRTNLGEREI